MITVEELKIQFGIRNVKDFGPCIVVPKGKFNIEWEQPLREQGVGIDFNVDLPGGDKCTVLRLKPEHFESAAEKPVYSPGDKVEKVEKVEKSKRKMPTPVWQDPESRWKLEEDKFLIELWNKRPMLSIAEIEKEVLKRYPKRDKGVKQRLARLRKAGKIEPRFNKGRPKKESARKDFSFKMKHSNEVIAYAQELASQTDPALSTRDISKKIKEKFDIKVSHVAVGDWLGLDKVVRNASERSVESSPRTSEKFVATAPAGPEPTTPQPVHTPASTPIDTSVSSEPKETEIQDLSELIKIVREIRDLLKPNTFSFEWHCRSCRTSGSAHDEEKVWEFCPVCGKPLIIWNVEEFS